MEPERVAAVRLESLHLGLSPRALDEGHVELLQQCPSPLPPILVHRASMTVVDGLHRFHAARRSGLESIAVVWFDGTFEQASIEAVRANVSHGKPLSIEQRRRAVKRVLMADPHLSDRAVAEICGLSPKTVAAVRLGTGEELPHPTEVTGRDGRTQSRIHGHSARGEAQSTSLDAGQTSEGGGAGTDRETLPPTQSAVHWWESDEALRSRCPSLVSWLSTTNPGDSPGPETAGIPDNRRYQLIDEAHRRAAIWQQLAAELERPH